MELDHFIKYFEISNSYVIILMQGPSDYFGDLVDGPNDVLIVILVIGACIFCIVYAYTNLFKFGSLFF